MPVTEEAVGLGEAVVLPGSTFKDRSTACIIPTRGVVLADDQGNVQRAPDGRPIRKPFFDHEIKESWDALVRPMNEKFQSFVICGDEVGVAFDNFVAMILEHPEYGKWKYILSVEDDNLPLPHCLTFVQETIEDTKNGGPFDGVGGIYRTKGDYPMPMCFGDPEHFEKTGELEFRPRDLRPALRKGHVIPCNGLACGFTLWRMDLFRVVERPWFVTMSEWRQDKGYTICTQDLFFCSKAKRLGAKFAIDARARVGHKDIHSGVIY